MALYMLHIVILCIMLPPLSLESESTYGDHPCMNLPAENTNVELECSDIQVVPLNVAIERMN